MTAQTGEVIFAKNEHKKHSMASTTKIMTALLATESGRLPNEIKVTSSMVEVEGTSMGLMGGDCVSLRELVYGMLLPSGNDAANACAFYLGGSIDGFAEMMNERAKAIGMNDTNFVTPSGLDDENHYSTAYDMALLGREAVKNPEFLKICSSKSATLTYGNPPYKRTLYNHNKLLEYYDFCLGIKTGFTKKSGRCLVSYAERDGVGLIAVTLNDKNDWYDHRQMLDYGFSVVKSECKTISLPKTIAVVGGQVDCVQLNPIDYYVESSAEKVDIVYRLPSFIYAPFEQNTVIGSVDVYIDGELSYSSAVTVSDGVEIKTVEKQETIQENKSVLQKIKEYFHG